MLSVPPPVDAVPLFAIERLALFDVLDHLAPDDWSRPSLTGTWTAKDIVAHLVADDLGRLSAQRDGQREAQPPDLSLKAWIDRRNGDWVRATGRLSPRVLRTLLAWSEVETQALFESLDPAAMGRPVSWAGPDPAPVWLDLARELTERWHHHQQLRAAVEWPPLADDALLGAVLATFARSLPPAFRDVPPLEGRAVAIRMDGPAGGAWTVQADGSRWTLWVGEPAAPSATVELETDDAWRMFVGDLDRAEVVRRATIDGNPDLASPVFDAFALVS